MARAADEVQQGDPRGMIGVRVTLFADLRRFLPPGVDGPHRRSVPAGSTVADLLAAIGVPEGADITVGVDGELADRSTPLREGTDVMLLSPMEGGSPLSLTLRLPPRPFSPNPSPKLFPPNSSKETR